VLLNKEADKNTFTFTVRKVG